MTDATNQSSYNHYDDCTSLSPARINVWMWIKIYLTLLLNIRLSRFIYLINIINKFKARLEKLTCAR